MRPRILSVGVDVSLLAARQALLTARGYDALIATPEDLDEKLRGGRFDLVVLSVTLSLQEKARIRDRVPLGTRVIALEAIVWPEELVRIVSEGLCRANS